MTRNANSCVNSAMMRGINGPGDQSPCVPPRPRLPKHRLAIMVICVTNAATALATQVWRHLLPHANEGIIFVDAYPDTHRRDRAPSVRFAEVEALISEPVDAPDEGRYQRAVRRGEDDRDTRGPSPPMGRRVNGPIRMCLQSWRAVAVPGGWCSTGTTRARR